jgi:glutamine synthetase
MDEVVKRLNWQHFPWKSWSDEGGVGQVELNFSPTDPVKAADTIVRAKQLIYVRLTLGCQ